jgi:hypothetical protein
VSEIRWRRFNPSWNPLASGLVVWTRAENGSYYARAVSFSRLFLSEVVHGYELRALRNFIRAVRAELSENLVSEPHRLKTVDDSIETELLLFSVEKVTRMLGLRYRYLHETYHGDGAETYPGWVDAEAYPWAYGLRWSCDDVFCPCEQKPARLDPPGQQVAA